MGRSSARARDRASSPHGYQSTGFPACWRRYGLAAPARRFGMRPVCPPPPRTVGAPGGDARIRRVLVPSAVAAGAGLGLLLPIGHDVQFSPVLAWFLAAINLAIIVGAIAWLLGRRGAHRPANPAPAPAPPGPNPA